MSLLPTRTNFNQSAASVLTDLKKGDKEKRNEFVWIHQQRFYAIALLATNNPETAEELTVTSFHNVFSALRQINPKQIGMPIWIGSPHLLSMLVLSTIGIILKWRLPLTKLIQA